VVLETLIGLVTDEVIKFIYEIWADLALDVMTSGRPSCASENRPY
jgi:hypothetical protein